MNRLSRGTDGDIFSIIPAGTIFPFAGDTAPEGWLICNGATIDRAMYPDLFDAIGTAWGNGNGLDTFHIPDLRGRFMRGVDGGEGNDSDAGTRTVTNSGGNSGDAVGSLQDDAFQGHKHLSPGVVNTSGADRGQSVGWTFDNNKETQDPIDDGANGLPKTSSETRPKNVAVNYIIRTGNPV
jgi:microcystin-dependent protein